jgi:hypothetical protein
MALRFVDCRSSPETITGSYFKTVDRGEQRDDAWRYQVQRIKVNGTSLGDGRSDSSRLCI